MQCAWPLEVRVRVRVTVGVMQRTSLFGDNVIVRVVARVRVRVRVGREF